jgi:hypothetical protein
MRLHFSARRSATQPHQGYRYDITLNPRQKSDVQSWALQEEKTAIKNQWYDSVINDIPS